MTRARFRPRKRALDINAFTDQLNFLIRLNRGNYTQTAKILGISRSTLINWRTHKTPPTGWYWSTVIHQAIKETIEDMQNSPIREVKRNARQFRREYSKAMAEEDTTDDIDNSGVTECQKYLLSLFKERPILNSKWLRKEGRYSRSQIRYAAEGLGLVIETVGFGEEKATTYTLPEDPLT